MTLARLTPLPGRGVVHLSGRDCLSFLQGLTTQHLGDLGTPLDTPADARPSLDFSGRRDGARYTCFLNPKVRATGTRGVVVVVVVVVVVMLG